ncbi:fam-a protein, fragment [Plasmodium vinckei brucechwatti]|uniref:Fam-a protein n=1 Tax=Plasmodium vinckei brucechwatti TaxID=119398 RepID=A0A6V7SDU0_PLAVN|nr:fam-a protein, fragment [Plasmodium vinckei brucechwatti]
MNKFYIQIVFFLLSIFIYTNNKTLATKPTPREQINKIHEMFPPRKQNIELFDAVIPPEELKKRNREYALSPELRAKIDAHSINGLASIYGGPYKLLLLNEEERRKEIEKQIEKQNKKQQKKQKNKQKK